MEHIELLRERALAGVDVDKFRRMDPREMNSKETTYAIIATALAWLLLEGVLHVVARGWLYRQLYPQGAPLHKKGQQQAAKAVTAGVGKLVSTMHNAIQIPLAVYVLLQPAVRSDTIYGHTRASTLMCLVSSGYFLYDLLVVLARFSQEGGAFLVHACCCLFTYTYAVYSFNLHFFGAGFLLWELSTPLVHLRWFLLKGGYTRSRLYSLNGAALLLVFFLCRPVWGTWLSYRFFSDTEAELRHPRPGGFPPSGIWGYRIANVALNLLNYYWFLKIAGKALQSWSPRSRKAGKIC